MADLKSGCVSYWPLHEKDGATRTDIVGSNNFTQTGSGTLNRTPGYIRHRYGFGANFPGDGTVGTPYLIKTSPSNLPSSDISIGGWVFPQSVYDGAWLLNNSDDGGTSWWELGMYSNRFLWFILNGNIEVNTGSVAPVVNQWQHVVVTHNHTGPVAKIYINGKQQASASDGFTGTLATTLELQIGNRKRGGDIRIINATVQGWGIWNYVLSAADVLALYQGINHPFDDPTLIGL